MAKRNIMFGLVCVATGLTGGVFSDEATGPPSELVCKWEGQAKVPDVLLAGKRTGKRQS